jgi:hypothetical protein
MDKSPLPLTAQRLAQLRPGLIIEPGTAIEAIDSTLLLFLCLFLNFVEAILDSVYFNKDYKDR